MLELPVVDLGGLAGAQRETEIRRRAGEEARRPFDLGQGPLVRVALLRLDDQDHVLLLTLHHIVADGWSMGVFVREMAALYAAFMAGAPSPLPELPIQYADFAHWQRQWFRGEVLEQQLSYWRTQLAGLPALRCAHGSAAARRADVSRRDRSLHPSPVRCQNRSWLSVAGKK